MCLRYVTARLALGACALILAAAADPSQQASQGGPSSPAAAMQSQDRAVQSACGTELATLCRSTDEGADAVMCLKTLSLDLSPQCRAAVKSAIAARRAR